MTWDVAGTAAAPVSCANVAIELSTDGGSSFGATLAASTANDGTEVVTIPNTPSATARVRVTCVGNIFFDISNTNFTIIAGSGAPAPDLISIAPTSGPTAGGTPVTLTGTDFVTGATVKFGAVAATPVTFNSSTSLSTVAPAQGAGTVAVTVTNPDTQSDILSAAFTYLANGYFSVVPCRLVDTRNANGVHGGPALAGGAIRTFPVAGFCGVPADASAVAVNLTVVAPSATGYLSLFASGTAVPPTSAIGFSAGQTRANNGIVSLAGAAPGSLDVLCGLTTGNSTDFLLDVTGYFR